MIKQLVDPALSRRSGNPFEQSLSCVSEDAVTQIVYDVRNDIKFQDCILRELDIKSFLQRHCNLYNVETVEFEVF